MSLLYFLQVVLSSAGVIASGRDGRAGRLGRVFAAASLAAPPRVAAHQRHTTSR